MSTLVFFSYSCMWIYIGCIYSIYHQMTKIVTCCVYSSLSITTVIRFCFYVNPTKGPHVNQISVSLSRENGRPWKLLNHLLTALVFNYFIAFDLVINKLNSNQFRKMHLSEYIIIMFFPYCWVRHIHLDMVDNALFLVDNNPSQFSLLQVFKRSFSWLSRHKQPFHFDCGLKLKS